jgi:alginate export protein
MSSRKDAFRRYLTSRARNRVIVASRWFASFACGLVLMIGEPPAYSQENVVVATDAVSQNEQNTQESQPKPSLTPEPKTQSLNIGGLTFSGSLRGRAENWSWFEAPPGQSDYTFGALLLRLSVSQKREKFDWLIEGLSPWLINLPTQAILPAPQGQLGLGATYYAANHNQDGSAVFRQGYVRFKGIFGDLQSSFQFGRFEFSDGAEVKPSDPTLATLKNDRIQQRLIGPFGFSHVGRGFDGIHFDRTSRLNNFTFLIARPVEGAYQLRSLYELDADLCYGAFTRQFLSKRAPGEARFFVLHYHDGRPILKTDNRPQTVRTADQHNIRITTFGGHYIAALGSGPAKTDLLLWGAAQIGTWGVLNHRAGAIGVEAGHKFDARMQPWLRAGYFRSSGDGNPNDNEHTTFFQILPTPRIYARTPFFNLMNNQDVFGQLLLKPFPKLSFRTDVHWLRLSNSHDLWYLGGGAYQSGTFGYTGRPSNGHADLGTLFDGSFDYLLMRSTTLTLYGSFVRGDSVEAAIYPQGGVHPSLHFVYLEFLQRF